METWYSTPGPRRPLPAWRELHAGGFLAAFDTADDPAEGGLFPGWRLHQLKGDLKGSWSVTVTGNWQLIFRFEAGNAFDLDLIDYH